MDASHAISVVGTQARAEAASAQSVTIVHLCPRCAVPRTVSWCVACVYHFLRVDPGRKTDQTCFTRWPRHACSCARYS